jgi:hypothetical protein
MSDRITVTSTSSHESTLHITSLIREDLGRVLCTVNDPIHLPLVGTADVVETDQVYLFGVQGNRTKQTLNIGQGAPLVLECPTRALSTSGTVEWFAGGLLLVDGLNGVRFTRSENGSSLVSLGTSVSLEQDDGDSYICSVTDGRKLLLEIEIYVTGKL